MTHRQLKKRLGSLSVVLLIAGHAEHLFAQTPAPGPSPLPISSSLTTSDTADSPPYASFVFVNKASLPVTAVAVVAKQKENRLATPIPVGDSWALSNIQPADHQCIELVKANSRMDLLCMELKAGKTYTYTITDGEADYAELSIINNTSLPIVAVKVGSNQSANLLSSPIPPGGQSVITHVRPTGLGIVVVSRSDGISSFWGRTLNAGETSIYVAREVSKKKKPRKWTGLVALADGEEVDLR